MAAMEPEMVQRVMNELRVGYPHDTEEMLEATATQTTLGAAIALRLALLDLGAEFARQVEPLKAALYRAFGMKP